MTELYRQDAAISPCSLGWHTVLIYPIIDVHFDDRINMVSASLLHCKVILSPFVTSKCFVESYFEICKYPTHHQISMYSFIYISQHS